MTSTALSTAPSTVLRGYGARPVSSGPSTPQSKAAAIARPETPSPGRWRHPKLQELANRRRQNTFDNSNVRTIVTNAGALVLTWSWRSLLSSVPFLSPGNPPKPTEAASTSLSAVIHLVLTVVFAANIFRAVLPLFTVPDNAADIDLSAEQRALLGLDPSATPPPTGATRYATPPKYARSASGASTPSSAGSAFSGAASFGSSTRSSPASGAFRSPAETQQSLWQRKVTSGRRSSLGGSVTSVGGASTHVPAYGERDAWMLSTAASPPKRDEWRFVPAQPWRSRSGSGTVTAGPTAGGAAQAGKASPLSMNLDGTGLWGASTSGSGFGGSVFRPDTPSPVGRASVPLKNKWLYERGRDERKY